MSFTNKIANFINEMKDVDLDQDLTQQFKKVYLDYLCAVISGSQTKVGKNVFQYFKYFGGNSSTLLGYDAKLDHLHAAFVNGTSAHCLDFDDGHTKGSVHPGSVVFSAVLAVAEKNESLKEEIIKAVIIGYEVTIHIASVMHPSSRVNGYHNTSVAGVFGAAAAVSYLLKLSYGQVIGALGNASSFAGGTFAFLGSGSEIKRLHPGIAARDGIIAAELTTKNILGPSNIFEKVGGVFDIFAQGNINTELARSPIGESFEIMNVYFKPYPCCRHLHVVIDAIKILKDKHQIALEQIDNINIGVTKVASFHGNRTCASLLDAQMSIPFVTAVTLLENEVTVDSFDDKKLDREQFKQIMQNVHVFADEECEKLYPQKRKTNISIHLKTGEVLKLSYSGVRGEPPNPMTMQEIEKKFTNNCIPFIGVEKVNTIVQKVKNLDILECLNNN